MSIQPDGVLISIEGLPCCGVTTQANKLFMWIDDHDIEPIQVRTPGGTALGREILHLLSNRPEIRSRLLPRAELFLMQADIAQLYAQDVLPLLQHNEFVITQEGGALSIVAFASLHAENDSELSTVNMQNIAATQGRVPDLTFFLDCKIDTVQARSQQNFRYNPYVAHELHLLREYFLVQSALNPEKVMVINGENSVEAAFNDIIFYVKPYLRKRGYDIGE